jgi:hypothetical protein
VTAVPVPGADSQDDRLRWRRVSGSSTGRSGRRRIVAVAVSASVGVLPLAGCSVPREADLVSSASEAGLPSPSPSGSPAVSVLAAPTPSPPASPSPPPSPTFAPLKPPTPKVIKGYRLSAAPRSVPNPLKGVKGANDVFGAMTVRSVSANGKPVGLVFLFAVRPQYLNDPQVTGAVLSRLTSSITRGGVPLKKQKWGRQTVCAGSSGKNGTIVIWNRGGVLSVVVGGNPGGVTSYAKALVAAS